MENRKSWWILPLLLLWVWSVPNAAAETEHPELKAFPAAKEGMARFVIALPHKERGEDDSLKVEIVPGRTMLTDSVNLLRLGCVVEPRELQGWGYTYYEVTGSGVVMSTMMAPPEGGQQVEKFVAGTSLLIRYNSRIPVVIYAPKGYEIRYRIWTSSDMWEQAKGG